MDYFKEVIHLVYLAKQLHEIGKTSAIQHLLEYAIADFEDLDMDLYYDAAFSAIGDTFEHTTNRYYERRGFELIVLSDKVIADYYILAGEYGTRNRLDKHNNPYFLAAEKEASRWFGFSYSLSWRLQYYTEPKRPFHSRLAVVIYDDSSTDIIGVAIGIAGMYQFFSQKCEEMRTQISTKGAAAA